MDSFVVYRSFYEAIRELDGASRLEAYDALMEYALDDIEPEAFESLYAKIVFTMAKPNIDANHERKTNGSKGGRNKKTNGFENEKPMVSKNENQWLLNEKTNGFENEKPMVIENENQWFEKNSSNEDEDVNEDVNEDEEIKEKENKKKSADAPRSMVRPTVDDVMAYITEQKYSVDAQAFVDFYSSCGWKVGNKPMKDWKAAVRTWERREKERVSPTVQIRKTAPPYPVRDFGAFID